jgi:hypothetical protein
LQFSDGDVSVHVTYLLRQDFHFQWEKNFQGNLEVTRCPGTDLLVAQSERADAIEEVIPMLKDWLRSVEIEDEIPSNEDEFRDLKEKVFKIIGDQIKDEEVFFTKSEAEDLKKKILILESKFSELIATLDTKDSEMKMMKERLKQARDDIDNMTKRKWKIVGAGKIVDVLSSLYKNKEIRSIAFEEVKKLMGLS